MAKYCSECDSKQRSRPSIRGRHVVIRGLPRYRVDTQKACHLAYPDRLKMSDVMELSQPQVIDSSPFYLRLTYDVMCRGKRGSAFCEVAYPHRLRWPVLGRMIEMSIGGGR